MEDDGNYGRPPADTSWVEMNIKGDGYGHLSEATITGSENDGALTAGEKRSLWIAVGVILLAAAVCCGAGVAVGVFFA